jgi:hypothetical protein
MATIPFGTSDAIYGAAPDSGKRSNKALIDGAFKIEAHKEGGLSLAKRGVDLIGLITQRLHNSPQLAINSSKNVISYQAQGLQSPGSTIAADPHLLIKPQYRQVTHAAQLWERGESLPVSVGAQRTLSQEPLITEFDIAMVPPRVVNGIQAIELGNSAKEVRQAIASLGQISKQHIDDWTVWSVQKPGQKADSGAQSKQESSYESGKCRLQIFMQAGIVEAIRVFDRSLLRPDLGVSLGDELALVKRRFGEPAFILAEPELKMSQNYIYPINQLGLQLERAKDEEGPRIVSVLIFNAR